MLWACLWSMYGASVLGAVPRVELDIEPTNDRFDFSTLHPVTTFEYLSDRLIHAFG